MRKKYVFLKSLKSFGENRVMIPIEKKKHRLYRESRAEGHGAEGPSGKEPLWTGG